MDWLNKFHTGDALTILKQMPDELVDCCITSPPYWGLRDYGVAGQLGLEKTPDEYVAKMVEVFREVRRVMKPQGTLWLNLGDSYATPKEGNTYGTSTSAFKTKTMSHALALQSQQFSKKLPPGLKPKDLCMIPARVALALQADGWWLRSDIIWSKPNPMPESVTDRPTKAHEYIFLLTKSAKYYFDAEAVREQSTYGPGCGWEDAGHEIAAKTKGCKNPAFRAIKPTRNIRSVWTIATQPYSEAHFATFPEKLVEPMIKAGTSEKGCCPECGKPWVRQVKLGEVQSKGGGYIRHKGNINKLTGGEQRTVMTQRGHTTLGWRPSCTCNHEPVPCIVLDPFIGSGTVARVAERLNRQWIGIDLTYQDLQYKRITNIQKVLF